MTEMEYKEEKLSKPYKIRAMGGKTVILTYEVTQRTFEREKVKKGKRQKPWKEIGVPEGERVE